MTSPPDDEKLAATIAGLDPDDVADLLVRAALEHDDVVPRASELLRTREPRGPRADDGDTFSAANGRRKRHDPTFGERVIDDLFFDLFDRHCLRAR